MTDFLQSGYVLLWAALAVLLFFTGRRLGAFGYVMSGFFVFMTVWYGLRAFFGIPTLEGPLLIVFRVVLGVFLAVIIGIWVFNRKKQ